MVGLLLAGIAVAVLATFVGAYLVWLSTRAVETTPDWDDDTLRGAARRDSAPLPLAVRERLVSLQEAAHVLGGAPTEPDQEVTVQMTAFDFAATARSLAANDSSADAEGTSL